MKFVDLVVASWFKLAQIYQNLTPQSWSFTCFAVDGFVFCDLNTEPLDSTNNDNYKNKKKRD